MPSSAIKAWVHIGHEASRPLAERWGEQSERLSQVAPGHPAQTMMLSEVNFDRRAEIIQRATQQRATAALPFDHDSPRRTALCDELFEVRRQYHALITDIAKEQRWLRAASEKTPHRLMAHISPDAFNEPPPLVRFGEYDCWTETARIKDMLEQIRPWLSWARQIAAQINHVKAWDALSLGEKALPIIERQLPAILDRLEAIESVIGAHEARLNPKQKRRRTA